MTSLTQRSRYSMMSFLYKSSAELPNPKDGLDEDEDGTDCEDDDDVDADLSRSSLFRGPRNCCWSTEMFLIRVDLPLSSRPNRARLISQRDPFLLNCFSSPPPPPELLEGNGPECWAFEEVEASRNNPILSESSKEPPPPPAVVVVEGLF